MKQLIIKILKIFLIVTSILFAVLLLFGLVLGIGWPWWVGLFILTGLLGLGVGLVFLKKVLGRRREQRFVNQVIEQDQHYLKSLGDKDRKSSKELQDRWKEAMETLRKSHLKKYGNPLYVLPWYMVIGESGSGKPPPLKALVFHHLLPRLAAHPGFPVQGTVIGGFLNRPYSLTLPGGMPFP